MGSVLNSISFVTGPLGSGKSYFAQKMVVDYLAAGKIVATNYDLTGPWWAAIPHYDKSAMGLRGRDRVLYWQDVISRAYRYDVQDDLFDWKPFGSKPSGEDLGLLVLDEGGLNMNSRLYQMRQKKEKDLYEGNPIKSLQFYINMRKRGWTCLILAHDSGHLDNQVQSMGGGVIKLRNYARMKMPLLGIKISKKPKFNARFFTPDVSSTIPEHRMIYGLDVRIANTYRSQGEFEFDPESRGIRLQVEELPFGNWHVNPGELVPRLRRAGTEGRQAPVPARHEPKALKHRRLRRLLLRVLSPSSARTPSITGTTNSLPVQSCEIENKKGADGTAPRKAHG